MAELLTILKGPTCQSVAGSPMTVIARKITRRRHTSHARTGNNRRPVSNLHRLSLLTSLRNLPGSYEATGTVREQRMPDKPIEQRINSS